MIMVNWIHLSSDADVMGFDWQKHQHNSATHVTSGVHIICCL